MKPSPAQIVDWTKTADGTIFVDELNHRLLVEDSRGTIRAVTGEFRYPRAVAVLDSLAYVVDSWHDRVRAFNIPEWTLAFDFGSLFCPSSIAIAGSLLVVADTNNRRLSFHRADGTRLFTYELDGFPRRVGIDNCGSIVVSYDDGRSETLAY
jgi:hypothetical protein